MQKDDGAWGEPVKGCRLSVSVAPARIQAGRSVELTLNFRNDGSSPVRYTHFSLWFNYDYSVFYGDGQQVPLTRFGERVKAASGMGPVTFDDLAPGKAVTSKVEISRLYDVSLPGPYEIQASKELPDPSGEGFIKVTSNRIKFDVVEP